MILIRTSAFHAPHTLTADRLLPVGRPGQLTYLLPQTLHICLQLALGGLSALLDCHLLLMQYPGGKCF